MKKFSELKVGDEFYAESNISLADLENYLAFSGIKNILYETNDASDKKDTKMVSGRAILGRMEGNLPNLKKCMAI